MWLSLLWFRGVVWTLPELLSPLQLVARPEAGVLTRQGALMGPLASAGDFGVVLLQASFDHKTLCFGTGVNFPRPRVLGYSTVLQHPWSGHDLNIQAAISPMSPPRQDLFALGTKQLFDLSAPPNWITHARTPPSPSRTWLPLPSLPVGRNRQGLSRPKVNIGFSGAVAGTRQRPSLSPPPAQKGLS